MLTDTHCHLDFDRFDGDRAAVLERAWQAGLARILIPGITLNSSRAAVKLAESHPNLFAAVGIHPNDSLTWRGSTRAALGALAERTSKVVAVGEIGLDYYRRRASPAHQQRVLCEQLELAAKLGLPLILHLREANDAESGAAASDLITILTEWVNRLRLSQSPLGERPGVLHSFSGTLETARAAMALGFFIGVSGAVTFKNAARRQEMVAALPLARILIETDAPFLAPQSRRGTRNEPALVAEIADKIALLHSRSREEVAAITNANATRLFSWGEIV